MKLNVLCGGAVVGIIGKLLLHPNKSAPQDCPLALQMRGSISAQAPWEVMVDLFFYRDPEETREQDEEGGEFTGAAADGAGGYGAQALPGPGGELVQKVTLRARPCCCPLQTTAYCVGGCSGQAWR